MSWQTFRAGTSYSLSLFVTEVAHNIFLLSFVCLCMKMFKIVTQTLKTAEMLSPTSLKRLRRYIFIHWILKDFLISNAVDSEKLKWNWASVNQCRSKQLNYAVTNKSSWIWHAHIYDLLNICEQLSSIYQLTSVLLFLLCEDCYCALLPERRENPSLTREECVFVCLMSV